MNIMQIVCYSLYYGVAIHLPKTNARLSLGSKSIRAALVRGFVRSAGRNIDIQKGARFSKSLRIGDNSGIGINCVLQGDVSIGNNVMMGPEVWIYTRNHEHSRTDIPMRDQGFEEEKPVVIMNDVWIGSRVTILPGVKIGNGAIVGTGAVVTKDIPDYSIVAGNPARIVKNRLVEG